jgi:hypothetical protein
VPDLKAVKGDNLDPNPGERHVRLRGIDYTITELDVDQHDKAMKEAEDKDGNVQFSRLLRAMVGKAVRPLPKTPFKFPVYRTLEGIVNEMHYEDVPDEIAQERKAAEEAAKEAAKDEGEPAPNA